MFSFTYQNRLRRAFVCKCAYDYVVQWIEIGQCDIILVIFFLHCLLLFLSFDFWELIANFLDLFKFRMWTKEIKKKKRNWIHYSHLSLSSTFCFRKLISFSDMEWPVQNAFFLQIQKKIPPNFRWTFHWIKSNSNISVCMCVLVCLVHVRLCAHWSTNCVHIMRCDATRMYFFCVCIKLHSYTFDYALA